MRVRAYMFEIAMWPGHHGWRGLRCCLQRLPSRAARLIYHDFIAGLAWNLSGVGFDTKDVLDFADFVREVDRGGEKVFYGVNGHAVMLEGALVDMSGFLKDVVMLPSCGNFWRWSSARPLMQTLRRTLPS